MRRWTFAFASVAVSVALLITACSAALPLATSTAPLPEALPSAGPIAAATPADNNVLPAATPLPPPTSAPPAQESRVLNVLLLGSDMRAGQTGPWRTDTIMWVTIHRDEKTVGILSIPRDLWVNIPWVGANRINVADYFGETYAYPGGGPALVADTLRNDLGLPIDRYVRLNFEAFEEVIDAMGGITVDVECPLQDNFIDDSVPGGFVPLNVQAGRQVMDGQTALMFARSRHSTDDIDRTRRQQRVLLGIRERALDINLIPRIPRIWTSLKKSVDTDLSLQEVLALALLAKDITPDRIHAKSIDFTMVSNWTTPEGAMVLLPDYARIQDAVDHLMDSAPLMEASSSTEQCSP